MKYMGSKSRIAKYILPIILENRKAGQWYVEPFVGGANSIDKVMGNRIGADINPYLIAALKLIQGGLSDIPKHGGEFSIEDYKFIRNSDDVDFGLKGYCGFQLSYGGKWFGGWRRDKLGKRDYIAEGYRNAAKQHDKINGVNFVCCDYSDLIIPKDSIVYCDPPYKGVTGYKDKFDHPLFWEWCRNISKQGHTVFISEYNMPNDFRCVWKKEVVSSLTKDTGSKRGVERLFRL